MRYSGISFRRRILGIYGAGRDLVQYDWYVNGNLLASGNGRSLNGGFTTIAEGIAAAGAGATIWIEPLYDGNPYRESLSISLSGIKVYSSGIYTHADGGGTWSGGARISGAEIVSSFTQAAAPNTNVFTVAVTVEIGLTQFVNYYEDELNLMRVADIAACQAAPGSYYVSGESGSITIGFQPSDSSDPNSNGKVYEYTKRIRAIYSNAAGCLIQGLSGEKALGDSGSISLQGAGCSALHFRALNGGSHTFQQNPTGGAVCMYGLVSGGYDTTSGTLINYNADVFASEDFTVQQLTVQHDSVSAAGYSAISGINGHQNTSGSLNSITMTDIVFRNLNIPISGCQDCDIVNLDIICIDCKYGNISVAGQTVNLTGGLWSSTTSGQRAINVTAALTLIASNFVIEQNGITDLGMVTISGAATVELTDIDLIENLAAGTRVGIYCSNAGASLTTRRLDFNKTGQNWSNQLQFTAGASGMTTDMDLNAYKLPTASWNKFSIFGTSYADFSSYQAAVAPNDANSTAT